MSTRNKLLGEITTYYVDNIIEKLLVGKHEYESGIESKAAKIYKDLCDWKKSIGDPIKKYDSYVQKDIRRLLYNVYYGRIKEIYQSFQGKTRKHTSKTEQEKCAKGGKCSFELDDERPVFDILLYPKKEIIEFFDFFTMSLQEMTVEADEGKVVGNEQTDRLYEILKELYPPHHTIRIKKNLNNTISLKKNYDLVYRVLDKSMWSGTVSKLGMQEEEMIYNGLRNDMRETAKKYHKRGLDEEFLKLYPSLLMEQMSDLWKMELECRHQKLSEYGKGYNGCLNICNLQEYSILWNLSIWTLNEGFQQRILHNEDFCLEERVQELEEKLENLYQQVSTKVDRDRKRGNIFEGFYVYNYMNQTYCKFAMEWQIWQVYLKKRNVDSVVYDEEYSVGNSSLTEVIDFSNDLTNKEFNILNKFLNTGTKKVELRTFKKRLKMCLEFIEKYGKSAGRRWNLENLDIKVVRSVYNVLYRYGLEYQKRSAYTWAKELLIMLNQEETESAQIEDGQCNRGELEEAHVIIGSMLNKVLMEQEQNGERINEVKYRIWSMINKIALPMYVSYCPGVNEVHADSFLKTETIFTKIFTMIDESIYK